MARCKVIGIFGGVGSGKSLATEYLKQKYHAYVIKADDVAHTLYRKGQPGYKAILRICGKSVLDSDRNIDRTKLNSYLMDNPSVLTKINAAIHPMVYKKSKILIDNFKLNHNKGLIVYEAALLPRDDLNFFDEKWFVKSDLTIRKDRLKTYRGYSGERIEMILSKQPSDEDYIAFVDKVITNNRSIKELEEQIDATL